MIKYAQSMKPNVYCSNAHQAGNYECPRWPIQRARQLLENNLESPKTKQLSST